MGSDVGFVDNTGQFAHYNLILKIKDLLTATGEGWTTLRYDTSTANHELILKGVGLTGAEEIFIGFRSYQSESNDYYNMAVGLFTGYLSGNTFDTQPNAQIRGMPLHNNRIDYWMAWNAQRFCMAAKVGTPVYESCYVGKFLPYARPSQYPYPIVLGSMLTTAYPATRFSDTSHSIPYKGNRANLRMRDVGGAFIQPYAMPYEASAPSPRFTRETGGRYHLVPIELYTSSTEIYGALDGIFFITGFNNTVENTVVIDTVTYVVIQDVYRTGFDDFYAMRLD